MGNSPLSRASSVRRPLLFQIASALILRGSRRKRVGRPTFVAISTEQGPKIFKPGERIDPARMRESWFVVWFAGARGWTNWDVPCF